MEKKNTFVLGEQVKYICVHERKAVKLWVIFLVCNLVVASYCFYLSGIHFIAFFLLFGFALISIFVQGIEQFKSFFSNFTAVCGDVTFNCNFGTILR